MTTLATALDAASYVVTDPFFGAPYIDADEERERPSPHRFVHGGFEGTDTRFAFYFPPAPSYQGRMFQPLEGGHGGNEVTFGGGMLGEMFQRIKLSESLGGYMVESNQGHIGDDFDAKAGPDPSLYGHRASAEAARFSKHVAAQVYGSPPDYSYVWGGSGGGRRSPLCLENAPGVWQGAMPMTSGGEIAEPGNNRSVRTGGITGFGQMFNVQRLLGDRLHDVVDAMAPGGSGDPFHTLDLHQREELALLYRLGYPRGNESMIAEPMGQMWLWTAMAETMVEEDSDYFSSFWTVPGYIGHDEPERVAGDVLNETVRVRRVITARDLSTDPAFSGPEFQTIRFMASMMGTSDVAYDMPYAIEVEGLGAGYRKGAGVRVLTGDAAGRQLYATGVVGDVFACDGRGEANLKRFTGVSVGDEVQVDNRDFLAFCYIARHHLLDDPCYDSLRVDGWPVYPSHDAPLMSPLMGVCYSGQYDGKLLWQHHTHDSSVWPINGLTYHRAVVGAQGLVGAADSFRLRWIENAEHGPAAMVPPEPNRASNTRLIDVKGMHEQSLRDLVDWVELGIPPAGSSWSDRDGQIVLPPTAAERGGIQPVVSVTANGADRAEVAPGTEVQLTVHAEVPPGAGTVISVEWDLDGSGSFPIRQDVDGTATAVELSITHSYDTLGTVYASARVQSHRHGDLAATDGRIENVAQARIVVTHNQGRA
ncbi:MAG: hypothetical protein QOE84_3732 [Actinomycetota bacterium]|nr:hypothetical protein [Actinomycetota bacterium]